MSRRHLLGEGTAFAFFLFLALFFTWPLAIRLAGAVSDSGDPLLNAWILSWDCYAFTHSPLHLFAAPMFSPAHLPLAYSEHMSGIALVVLPFYLFGASAITLHGIAMLLGFTLSGYGAYVLARVVTRNSAAAVVAGIFHGWVSFRISHIPHVQILWSGWLPLILAALIVFHRKPTRRNAALFAAAFVMNGLSNIYFLLFAGVAVVLTIWLFAIAQPRDWTYRRRLLGALAVSGLILLPFLAPYSIVSNEYHMTRMGAEALSGSASWTDWLVPAGNNTLYASIPTPDLPRAERQLFPGLLAILLLLAAALWTAAAVPAAAEGAEALQPDRRSRYLLDAGILAVAVVAYFGLAHGDFTPYVSLTGSDVPLMLLAILLVIRLTPAIRGHLRRSRFSLYAWAGVVWIVVGVLGSFGRNGFFGEFLFRRTVVFRSLRALARFAVIAYVGLAVWVALGVVALLALVPRPAWRRVAVAVLVAAALADVWPKLRWHYVWMPPRQADLWLRDHGRSSGGSTLELPLNNFNSPFVDLIGAAVHHTPIMNGTSGFEPPVHRKLREAEEKLAFDDDFTTTVERNGGALVLVHGDYCGKYGPAISAWIGRNIANGRMTFVRRFDEGILGAWLFTVTRNARIRGVAEDPLLAKFLNGEMTYNATTFGRMDQPREASEVSGPLTVSGWALSPNGIRSATVLLDAGRVRVPTVLSAREDVSRAWPWYPQTPAPAFTASLPRRPPGVDELTDVQVEIVDGKRNVTRFNDARITWK